MGGTQSSTIVDNIASTAVKLSANSISTCTQNMSQEQIARISGAVIGDGNIRDISQTAEAVIQMNCQQKANVNFDMQQAVISAIQQEAKATGTDFSVLGGSKTNSVITMRQELEADINMDSIVNSIVETEQKQIAEITGVTIGDNNISRIRQGVTQEMFMDSLSEAVKKNKFVQDIANELAQSGESETKSTITGVIDSVTDMVKGNVMMVAFVFIAAVIGIAIIFTSDEGTEKFGMAADLAGKSFGGGSAYNDIYNDYDIY